MRGHSRRHWARRLPVRLRFEHGLRDVFPDLSISYIERVDRVGAAYRLSVPVKGYGARRLTIRVKNVYRPEPRVFADGPTASPHRWYHRGGDLCMWHPHDPPTSRWHPAHGLLALVRHAQLHLFREAWWREKGEWLGPEAPHGRPGQAGSV